MIIDLQRRLVEAGRIRIGQQVKAANGRMRPDKLDTFRLTSADKVKIEQAAELFGGTVEEWDAPSGPQWQVITRATVLDIVVPPSTMAFSLWYELWSAGGCQRRCDGVTEQLTDGPCLCDPDRRECGIHARLSVMLRDLAGLGLWRIDSGGFYAAVELSGAVEVIQLAAGRGQMLPARLRLEQRQVKREVNGKPQTRKFAVPVLDVDVSPGQLISGARQVEQLDPSTGELRLLTPVPAALPAGPVASVAEQAKSVEEPAERRPRRNASTPLPPTGLAPRTAAEANEEPVHPVAPVGDIGKPDPATPAQLKALGTAFGLLMGSDRSSRLAYAQDVVGRPISSSKELTKAEASRVLDAIHAELDSEPGAS